MMLSLVTLARRATASVLIAVCAAATASAQTETELFDDTRLHSVEIVIHSRDWSNTSREYGSNTMRSPGPQRRVSMRSWKRFGNSFL